MAVLTKRCSLRPSLSVTEPSGPRHQPSRRSCPTSSDGRRDGAPPVAHVGSMGTIVAGSLVAASATMRRCRRGGKVVVTRTRNGARRAMITMQQAAVDKTALPKSDVPLSGAESAEPPRQESIDGQQDPSSSGAAKSKEQSQAEKTQDLQVVVPSDEALNELFDSLDEQRISCIREKEVKQLIPILNSRFHFDLDEGDTHRLYNYFDISTGAGMLQTLDEINGEKESHFIPRNVFVSGLRQLATALKNLGSMKMKSLKIVLVAAFDKFDQDQDGEISLEEFMASTVLLGLKLNRMDGAVLHRFFSDNDSINQVGLVNESPMVEKWTATLNSSLQRMRDKYRWTSMEVMCARAQESFEVPGSIDEKLSRALNTAWESAEEVCDFLEFVADMAALAFAISYVSSELNEEITTGTIQDLDLTNVAPCVVCLGLFVANIAKELDELVPKEMNPEEALLYAQYFKKHGFSQAEFRRILSAPGCKWVSAKPGDVLNAADDKSVKIIVKGGAEVICADLEETGEPGIRLQPGSSIGAVRFLRGRQLWGKEVVIASEPVLYIAWDPDGLRRCMQSSSIELSLRMDSLLASTFAINLQAVMKIRERRNRKEEENTAKVKIDSQIRSFEGILTTLGLDKRAALGKEDLAAFFKFVDNDLGLSVTNNVRSQLFQFLDKDKDGVVSPAEFCAKMTELERCFNNLDGLEFEDVVVYFAKGTVDQDDLRELTRSVKGNMFRGGGEKEQERLFAFIDQDNDGEVSLQEFLVKVEELETSLAGMGGLSMNELATLLHRAFQQFDANGDGNISLQEFLDAVRRLQLPLSEQQARTLHSYFDTDKDGFIDLGEWRLGNAFPAWIEALQVTLEKQVQRTGLSRFGYFAETIQEIVDSNDSAEVKKQKVVARLWEGTNELADIVNSSIDSVGVLTALSGVYQEISSVSAGGDLFNINLVPFVLFLVISSVQLVRNVAEGQVTDLAERDALIYATAFQKWGFSVTQFRRLLSYGSAKWETFKAGEAVFQTGQNKDLRLISQGNCDIFDGDMRLLASVGVGSFLGVVNFLDRPSGLDCPFGTYSRCTEDSTILTWDSDKLQERLGQDEELRLKVMRALTISLADRVLSAKDYGEEGESEDDTPQVSKFAGALKERMMQADTGQMLGIE